MILVREMRGGMSGLMGRSMSRTDWWRILNLRGIRRGGMLMILWYVRLRMGLILIALRRRRVGHGTRIRIAPSRNVNFIVA